MLLHTLNIFSDIKRENQNCRKIGSVARKIKKSILSNFFSIEWTSKISNLRHLICLLTTYNLTFLPSYSSLSISTSPPRLFNTRFGSSLRLFNSAASSQYVKYSLILFIFLHWGQLRQYGP